MTLSYRELHLTLNKSLEIAEKRYVCSLTAAEAERRWGRGDGLKVPLTPLTAAPGGQSANTAIWLRTRSNAQEIPGQVNIVGKA